MRTLRGNLEGTRLCSRFMDVALEYMATPHKLQWVYTPCIITLRDPSDERFVMEAADAFERRAHRRNMLIEMRERIPEVMDALRARPSAVIPDTIQRLGLSDCFYRFGAQIRLQSIPMLERMNGLENCSFREIDRHDIPGTARLRIAA